MLNSFVFRRTLWTCLSRTQRSWRPLRTRRRGGGGESSGSISCNIERSEFSVKHIVSRYFFATLYFYNTIQYNDFFIPYSVLLVTTLKLPLAAASLEHICAVVWYLYIQMYYLADYCLTNIHIFFFNYVARILFFSRICTM